MIPNRFEELLKSDELIGRVWKFKSCNLTLLPLLSSNELSFIELSSNNRRL